MDTKKATQLLNELENIDIEALNEEIGELEDVVKEAEQLISKLKKLKALSGDEDPEETDSIPLRAGTLLEKANKALIKAGKRGLTSNDLAGRISIKKQRSTAIFSNLINKKLCEKLESKRDGLSIYRTTKK
jgi:hypothetical protein